MLSRDEERFRRRVLFINAALPVLLVAWDFWHGNLGANPVEFITRASGIMTLLMLAVTLTVTPLAQRARQFWLAKQRRLIGLFAFFYGTLHFLTYAVFDRGGKLASVPADVAKRPFIAVGMICYLLMIPLAVTSTDRMVRRLGFPRWKRLHQLTYVIAAGGVIHFWMIVKSDVSYPLAFAVAVFLLLALRWRTPKRLSQKGI